MSLELVGKGVLGGAEQRLLCALGFSSPDCPDGDHVLAGSGRSAPQVLLHDSGGGPVAMSSRRALSWSIPGSMSAAAPLLIEHSPSRRRPRAGGIARASSGGAGRLRRTLRSSASIAISLRMTATNHHGLTCDDEAAFSLPLVGPNSPHTVVSYCSHEREGLRLHESGEGPWP